MTTKFLNAADPTQLIGQAATPTPSPAIPAGVQGGPGLAPSLTEAGSFAGPAKSSTPATSTALGWPDALIGLGNFIAATKGRGQRPAPAPQSFAGIGRPAQAGPLGNTAPQAATQGPARGLGSFI